MVTGVACLRLALPASCETPQGAKHGVCGCAEVFLSEFTLQYSLIRSKRELVMNHDPLKSELALEGHGRGTHSD